MYCITIQKIFYSLLHVFFLPFLSRHLWMHKHKIKTKMRMISKPVKTAKTLISSLYGNTETVSADITISQYMYGKGEILMKTLASYNNYE